MLSTAINYDTPIEASTRCLPRKSKHMVNTNMHVQEPNNPAMERLRTIILLLPAVLSKRNCCLDFPQLNQKLRNAAHSVAMSTTWVIIGPTLWPFLRANPRRQRCARSCRNISTHFVFFLFCFDFFCTSLISFCNFFTFYIVATSPVVLR